MRLSASAAARIEHESLEIAIFVLESADMSPCQSCHAGCCRAYAVPISGADIVRIQNRFELSFWEFVYRWADPQGEIALNHAPQFFFSDEPQTPYVVCLKQVESEYFPESSKCRFLMESPPDEEHPLGVARCGIHPDRPGTCRAYPTKLDDAAELAIIDEVAESGRPCADDIYKLCPRQWEPADFDPVTTIQDLVVVQYEMTYFHKLALIWNQNPQSWLVFPQFLELVYKKRVIKSEVAESHRSDHNILPFPVQGIAPNSSAKAA